ncbi:uncharacterized protein JCM10292_000722 [Rhodotorula paludigena]|uniref:uncharacterized protein n=1 Tax=Rhodotorula paludigena TaxID=86838 RepID=UPI00317D361F
MLARTALRSTRIATPAAPRLARAYAEQATPKGEPVNFERGQSRMPVYFAGALALLVGGYFVGGFNTPPTPAVKAMQEAYVPTLPIALCSTQLLIRVPVLPLSTPSNRFLSDPLAIALFCRNSMHPKTPEAKLAAGIRDDPHDEPTKAGGDLKGRQPPK